MEKSWNCVFEFLWESCKVSGSSAPNIRQNSRPLALVKNTGLHCLPFLVLIQGFPVHRVKRYIDKYRLRSAASCQGLPCLQRFLWLNKIMFCKFKLEALKAFLSKFEHYLSKVTIKQKLAFYL